jgi:hypothetical protein
VLKTIRVSCTPIKIDETIRLASYPSIKLDYVFDFDPPPREPTIFLPLAMGEDEVLGLALAPSAICPRNYERISFVESRNANYAGRPPSEVDNILLVLFPIIKVAILSLVNRTGGYTTTILS